MGTVNLLSKSDLLVTKTILNLSINVLGTEQRNVEGFFKHTIYIIEINLNEFIQKLFLR